MYERGHGCGIPVDIDENALEIGAPVFWGAVDNTGNSVGAVGVLRRLGVGSDIISP
jgi:hypothetical protein